jgi:hypothetical protein
MTFASSRTLLAQVAGEHGAVMVYEEVPGCITVSFARSPGMWAAFSMPPEAADMVTDAIAEAMRNRAEAQQ